MLQKFFSRLGQEWQPWVGRAALEVTALPLNSEIMQLLCYQISESNACFLDCH